MTLALVKENTETDVANYKLGKQIIGVTCKPCGFRWTGTIEDIGDRPECPRCKN